MRAIAILLFGLAAVAVFAGSAGITSGGSLAFGAPDMTFVIIALVLVAGGVVALYFAQKPRPKG
jgi:hypothetical protein